MILRGDFFSVEITRKGVIFHVIFWNVTLSNSRLQPLQCLSFLEFICLGFQKKCNINFVKKWLYLNFSTDKEISDPIYNESHHYTWTWNHFKIADSAEVVSNLSHSNLLYSIVRHPFERWIYQEIKEMDFFIYCLHFRVVSAYENKILRPEIRLGAWFLASYGEPTFPKFVDSIIEGSKDCHVGVCQSLDEHWKPFYAGCTYCDLKYDFITKVRF